MKALLRLRATTTTSLKFEEQAVGYDVDNIDKQLEKFTWFFNEIIGIIKPCNAMTVEEMANELCPLLLKI